MPWSGSIRADEARHAAQIWLTLAPSPLEAKFLTPAEREWVHRQVLANKVPPCPRPADHLLACWSYSAFIHEPCDHDAASSDEEIDNDQT